MDKDTQVAEGTDGEARKRDLEMRKLDSEIAQLQLPWWKKPSYLGAILPVAVATLTLGGAVFTGYFDAQRVRLINEKTALEEDVQTLRIAGAELTQHFRQTLSDLEQIAGQKSDELRTLVNLIGTRNEQQIMETARRIGDEIDKIKSQVDTGKKMLNELPSFE